MCGSGGPRARCQRVHFSGGSGHFRHHGRGRGPGRSGGTWRLQGRRGRALRMEGGDRGLLHRQRARRSVRSGPRPRCRPGKPGRRPDDLVSLGPGGFGRGRAVDLAHRQHACRIAPPIERRDHGMLLRPGQPLPIRWPRRAGCARWGSRADRVRRRHDRGEWLVETRKVHDLGSAGFFFDWPVPQVPVPALDGPCDCRPCPQRRPCPNRGTRRKRSRRGLEPARPSGLGCGGSAVRWAPDPTRAVAQVVSNSVPGTTSALR